MPVVFTAHGSPMNAIQDNVFTKDLRSVVKRIPRPKAILVVSAHWTDDITAVTSGSNPEQIYDFYGFPDELYNVKYAAPGNPDLADRIHKLETPVRISKDAGRGIDHGAWSVLVHMYPAQDIHVLQLSLNDNLSPADHFALAGALMPLRSEGVLIIGSGNIVHNLQRISYDQFSDTPFDWAQSFDAYVKDALVQNNADSLIHYDNKLYREARMSVPTTEHYLPLLYIEGLRKKNDSLRFFHEGYQHQSLSMRSYILEQNE
jgi:4,5-DOPA dioxygenase extradiol